VRVPWFSSGLHERAAIQRSEAAYPDARELLITADSDGSNSARGRLWKLELQKL
jgi:Rhodopirellula transposase DDE domain